MKILVNAANIVGGGGLQKAVEFVRRSARGDTSHTFSYAVSRVVLESLQALGDTRGLDLAAFDVSPARPVRGRATRKALRTIEERFRPDVVYSIFGPAYVRFRSPHLMGFAVPWVTHPNPYAWRAIANPVERARHWAWCRYVTFWTGFADRWVLETRVAAEGLSRALRVAPTRLHVVPNTYGEPYARVREVGAEPDARMRRREAADFHLLVFTRWYPHKNLEIVPAVAAELRRRAPARRYRFFLTFETASREWARIRDRAKVLGAEEDVVNLGPVRVDEGPGLYAAADALFLPTLLETFSASYPEAMCMRRPIVTTDLPFARDVCGEAALYFPPNGAVRAAEEIVRLAGSEALRGELVRKGTEMIGRGIAPGEAYGMFLELLERTTRSRGSGAC